MGGIAQHPGHEPIRRRRRDGSKPYVASGKYIQRMSPAHCKTCRFDPALREGEKACPFTTLYWDFLGRHEALLAANPRTVMQVKNWARLNEAQRAAIAERAATLKGPTS